MFTSENNWYSWQYGDGEVFGRQTGDLQFKTNFGRMNRPVKSFKEELLLAAQSTLDYHPNLKPNLFFSGGVDSDIMLRSYLEIGCKPKVTIVRYENDYNLYDVSYAVTVCSMLNVEYDLIDFNLTKFYENDAERMSELSQIDRPRALPYCKFIEDAEGFPVLGNGDLTLHRTMPEYIQDEKGQWVVRCWEHDIGWTKFARTINKPAVAEWFKWTPGLVLSYMNLNWFSKLTNDGYIGKLSENSTKIIGYREAYSDLIDRKKQTGFEKINPLVDEFESFLRTKYKGLPFRQWIDRTIMQLASEIIYCTDDK
jgi:hypothetical protein